MIFFFSVLYKPQENAITNIVRAKSFGFIPIVYLNDVSEGGESSWVSIRDSYLGFFKDDIGMIWFNNHISNETPDIVISSGCTYSLKILRAIGYHDDSYFVEGVDYELCLRLKVKGYKIRSVRLNTIDHFTLQDKMDKFLFGKKINVRCYGWRRLIDFNGSHFRLISKAIEYGQFKMLLFFIKSIIMFNFRNLLNRLLMVVL